MADAPIARVVIATVDERLVLCVRGGAGAYGRVGAG